MIISNQPKRNIQRKTTIYNNFRGVDFSVDPSLISSNRSPYAINLISDIGGMPEKRLGWRVLRSFNNVRINGLYYGEINGQKKYVIHAGSILYVWDGSTEPVAISYGITNQKSNVFFMRCANDTGKMYIQTGLHYLCYDGTYCRAVSTIAKVPTVIISRNPTGGGTLYEPINLLSDKRIDSFLGNSTDLVYQLSANNLTSVDRVEVMNSNGQFYLLSGSEYTVNIASGQITFTTPKIPIVIGQDNVKITYSKTVLGYADRINKCTIADLYGVGSSNRVFLSGNPDYKSYDWHSEIYDPTYFPDVNYSIVGTSDTAIMGYQKIGRYQVIIKEENQQDSTIFQRIGTIKEDGTVVFSLEQGIAGIGAISKNCFNVLADEPLFLARQGVYSIASNNILAERTTRNRSFFVDYKLTKENNLNDAISCVWNGFYILCINGNAYVLDSKNKAFKERTTVANDFNYECYFWNNIPAKCLLVVGNELFFGTEDGKICKFNTDINTLEKYSDDGNPITAIWSTKNDDDNASYLYKTMQKKGCMVTIKPYIRSSAKIYISKDGEIETFINQQNMDIFDFNDIDFRRWTFNTNDSPQDIFLTTKIKKYKRLQIIIKNDVVNEGFGIFQIAKTYIVGNYAKK